MRNPGDEPHAKRGAFVSYGRASRAHVEDVRAAIEGWGWNVWFDRDISGGQLWWEAILSKIRECDAFVIALDAAALASKACELELNYARVLRKPVLPVLLDHSALPTHLSQIQFVDYRRATAEAAFALGRALQQIPVVPLPDPLPPPPPAPDGKAMPIPRPDDAVEPTPPPRPQRRTMWALLHGVVAAALVVLVGFNHPVPDQIVIMRMVFAGLLGGAAGAIAGRLGLATVAGAAIGWLLFTISSPKNLIGPAMLGLPIGAVVGASVTQFRSRVVERVKERAPSPALSRGD